MKRNLNNEKKINIWDFMLIIGVLTTSMTALRVGKIGLSEIFLGIWMLRIIYQYRYGFSFNIYLKFWLVFIFSMTVGTLIANIKGIEGSYSILDILTYLFFFLFVFSISQFSRDVTYKKGILILKKIYFWGMLVYGVLFFVAYFITPSLLGFNFWFGTRLSILALNPHQFIYITVPLLLLGVFLFYTKKLQKFYEKAGVVFGTFLFFWMSLETESSTFVGTITLIIIINLVFVNHFKLAPKGLLIFRTSILISLMSIILIKSKEVYIIIYNFINNDANGLGRIDLWMSGIEKIFQSPIFGLGFGSYIEGFVHNEFLEAHNTYIDLAMRGGLISLILFILVVFYSYKKLSVNICLLNFLIFFLLYGMSGYTLRRVTLWFFIIFLVSMVQKEVNSKKV